MIGQLGRRACRGAVGGAAAADVAYLSGAMFTGGVIDPRDAADLIAFDRMVVADAPEWAAFFVNAIAGHLLVHTSPADSISADKAEWLEEQFAPGGRAESPRTLPLLLRLMEGAHSVVPALPAFALRQVLNAIITGEGPLSAGRVHFSRVVDGEDVALLRRLLSAGGGGEGRAVSRQEADALFDIHDATIGAGNEAGFEPLFVRAIVQHVRAASGLHAGSRGSLSTAFADTRSGAHLALDLLALAGYQPDLASLVEPATLSDEAARWLTGRLLREGRASAAGAALVRLLANTEGASSKSLRALLDRAA